MKLANLALKRSPDMNITWYTELMLHGSKAIHVQRTPQYLNQLHLQLWALHQHASVRLLLKIDFPVSIKSLVRSQNVLLIKGKYSNVANIEKYPAQTYEGFWAFYEIKRPLVPNPSFSVQGLAKTFFQGLVDQSYYIKINSYNRSYIGKYRTTSNITITRQQLIK